MAINETDTFKAAVKNFLRYSTLEDSNNDASTKWSFKHRDVQQDLNNGHSICHGMLDIQALHSWDDVMSEVRNAMEKHAQKTKGAFGVAECVGRALRKQASGINSWLELFPCGDYSSIVCGGLKLVFGVSSVYLSCLI